mgnify:CR=1 FL=1
MLLDSPRFGRFLVDTRKVWSYLFNRHTRRTGAVADSTPEFITPRPKDGDHPQGRREQTLLEEWES